MYCCCFTRCLRAALLAGFTCLVVGAWCQAGEFSVNQKIRANAGTVNFRQGAGGPAMLWDRFVGCLRIGDYQGAYACFSRPSQKVFPYQQFTDHFNPLTAVYEAAMSPLDNGQIRMNGGLAYLSFTSAPLAGGKARGIKVTALMTREQGRWFLVASVREKQAQREAAARKMLLALWQSPEISAARTAGRELSVNDLRKTRLLSTARGKALLQSFDFVLEPSGRTGLRLAARPLKRGLRGFVLGPDDDNIVRVLSGHEPVVTMAADKGPAKSNQVSNIPQLPPPPPDMGDPEKRVSVHAPEGKSSAGPMPQAGDRQRGVKPVSSKETGENPADLLENFNLPDLPDNVPEADSRPDTEPDKAASSPKVTEGKKQKAKQPTPRKHTKKLKIALPPLPPPDRGDPEARVSRESLFPLLNKEAAK